MDTRYPSNKFACRFIACIHCYVCRYATKDVCMTKRLFFSNRDAIKEIKVFKARASESYLNLLEPSRRSGCTLYCRV